MPKVSAYKQRVRRLTVPFEDADEEPLHVAYHPRAITPKMERAFAVLNESQQYDQIIFDSLAVLIESWDLTDDDGTELPRTKDALENLPSYIVVHVWQKILEDISPNASSPDLPNGLAPGTSEEPAPIGTSFS